jgi:hypothetical protein
VLFTSYDLDSHEDVALEKRDLNTMGSAYTTTINDLFQSKKRTVTAIEAETAPTVDDMNVWGITNDDLVKAGISTS